MAKLEPIRIELLQQCIHRWHFAKHENIGYRKDALILYCRRCALIEKRLIPSEITVDSQTDPWYTSESKAQPVHHEEE